MGGPISLAYILLMSCAEAASVALYLRTTVPYEPQPFELRLISQCIDPRDLITTRVLNSLGRGCEYPRLISRVAKSSIHILD